MKKEEKRKYKRRVFILSVISIPLTLLFVSTLSSWHQGLSYKRETELLKAQLNETLEKEDELKSQISKLQDPEYVARYAREKYLYSKSGEIIIRMED